MAFLFKEKPQLEKVMKENFGFEKRRAVVIDIDDVCEKYQFEIDSEKIDLFEKWDLIYRTLCAVLYNFVPTSGHPGGSISSGRFVAALLYNTLDYDFSNPNRKEADIISYAAGHKALGLYAMWAIRNEIMRVGRPDMLPAENLQLRFEDLLGFRRNPTNDTPLFRKFRAKPLDGHPTPYTPFIKISTGASGVGVPTSLGLALGAIDIYRNDPPRVHMVEGEGGMTPGRVHEALASASSARLWNAIMHVDWNQASIDSNRVCREESQPGDYVQWNPVELGYLHDWNVIFVRDGKDFKKILAAQQLALMLDTFQPTMVVYRTIKGWKYGIEGRKSHGAGHKFCSNEFYKTLEPFEEKFGKKFERAQPTTDPVKVEEEFWKALLTIRSVIESEREMVKMLSSLVAESRERLISRKRMPHGKAPDLSKIYNDTLVDSKKIPPQLILKPGTQTTLRGELGKVLGYLNNLTGGAIFGCAADLLDSTSISELAKGFPEGFYDAVSNFDSRLIAIGGICEDAMSGFMSGLSAMGFHIGSCSSYGAFIAPLSHIAARLHGIGQQMKKFCVNEPYNTCIIINAHAGIKTGEDGPTHADPQALQLLQENFPKGVLITLTPWEPGEMWPLVVEGLKKRPAILAPFVTRPPEKVIDREKLKIPDPTAAIEGIYAFRRADMSSRQYNGTIVLQGSGVAITFANEVLPELDKQGLNMNIFYISSVELFDTLPAQRQDEIFPPARAIEAMGITDFTLPTMYRWVISAEGRKRTLYPHKVGHFLGSGQAYKVMQEANLHAEGQYRAILEYAHNFEKKYRENPDLIYNFSSP